MLADLTDAPDPSLDLPERGYPTPKVDVRAGVFRKDGNVLLVREESDGRWALPGGWADEHDGRRSPAAQYSKNRDLATAIKLAAVRPLMPYASPPRADLQAAVPLFARRRRRHDQYRNDRSKFLPARRAAGTVDRPHTGGRHRVALGASLSA
jgi:hypothetical protein